MIAFFTDVTPGADIDNDAGAFMPEDRRKQSFRIGAGQREFVGVADAGGLDLDQHFAGLGAFELNRRDFERLARRDRYCRFDIHHFRSAHRSKTLT